MSDVTLILQGLAQGDAFASGELMPLVYEELRRLAAIHMGREPAGQTLQPTALVHEAWMRLAENHSTTWENRGHFFAAAAEAMRRIMIERARRRARHKHGGGRERVDIDHLELAAVLPDDKTLLVDEALEQLKEKDPETARVVLLKFFGGLTNEEIVEVTGASERTVRRQWNYAKAWLYKRMQQL
jgi:RNA polymerase sigma factor (TIGR02999 family)